MTSMQPPCKQRLFLIGKEQKRVIGDMEFLAQIIEQICDYAVKNGMEPDDTMKTIANNLLSLLEISTFNGWEVG